MLTYHPPPRPPVPASLVWRCSCSISPENESLGTRGEHVPLCPHAGGSLLSYTDFQKVYRFLALVSVLLQYLAPLKPEIPFTCDDSSPGLLTYNRYTILCKLKVYNMT